MTTFKDAEDGYRAVIEKHYSGEMIRIYVSDGEGEGIACHLDPADAPAIALAVLKAGGVDDLFYHDAAEADMSAGQLADMGAFYLALSVEKTEAKAAAAAEEAARDKRRDELALKFTGQSIANFDEGWVVDLIDRIIDTENELAKERTK